MNARVKPTGEPEVTSEDTDCSANKQLNFFCKYPALKKAYLEASAHLHGQWADWTWNPDFVALYNPEYEKIEAKRIESEKLAEAAADSYSKPQKQSKPKELSNVDITTSQASLSQDDAHEPE